MNVRAFFFQIPTAPLPIRGKMVTSREGILLQSVSDPASWSEASPLPGFSHESIDDVVHALQHPNELQPASLQFAMSCLESNLPSTGSIPVNALLAGNHEHVLEQLDALLDDYSTFKLKVGRQSLDADIRLTNAITDKLESHQKLRLDANRAWTLQHAVSFGNAIDSAKLEYIEEPTQSSFDLEAFYAKTGIVYALDETLQATTDGLESFRNVAAFVIKPTLIGDVTRIAKLSQFGIPITFSSAFESGVGIYHIARLAAKLSPNISAGLDTYRWLHRDVVSPTWKMEHGTFHFEPPEISDSTVTEIDPATWRSADATN